MLCSQASPDSPLRQDIAVTGSGNQKERFSPSAASRKIEGFFDVVQGVKDDREV